ncbi:small multidrug resistance protein [Hyphomicrobium denitrificans 1NES1]|uniref:Guanidinium exporter n=1 Tax=Hyphomicrobium denitrificans 1NES1 TaxID=670307 RepID=N0B835_9HYPH|nr:multidrug efflux SMR transporter [Hyphomicrobium denitrificans]AGK59183.1 small multidrug resistance protein [Hyphomicrobium denitrificans 1NES1]
MAWVFLISAGLLETVWAFYMKKSDGFTLLWPTVITAVAMLGSVVLLSLSMKTLPLSSAYVVWTGIGSVGAFLLGVTVLGEEAALMRFFAATLIVGGIALMKLSSSD